MGLSDGDGTQEVQVRQRELLHQHVVVMRHGDRIDNFEPMWDSKASRPWDPPLTQDGKDRAFARGRKFRTHLHFPIHRLFVSPFLRCLQTAAEVIHGLCAVDDHDPAVTSSAGITIDPSKIKLIKNRTESRFLMRGNNVEEGANNWNQLVSVEYGLCEMFNDIAIRPKVAPKDHNFGFVISECEAHLPAGTIDRSMERVKEMPQWGELTSAAQARYAYVIKTLADKYPSENLLFVTHGEGVGSSVSAFSNVSVSAADYCGYSHMSRPIFSVEGQSFTAGDFKVHVMDGENGLSYYQNTDEPDST